MEVGILETEEERHIRRHKQYLKAREQGKDWAKNTSSRKYVKPKHKKLSELSPEDAQRRREMKHRAYLKAKALDKVWIYPNRKKPLSDEQKEKRRIYSAKYKAEHSAQTKENMRRWRAEHGEEEKRSWQEYRRNNKKLAIEYMGGVCFKCGGIFHPDVYDFHHKDLNEKDICVARLLVRKFDVIKIELDKCVMLCANCHRIEHAQY